MHEVLVNRLGGLSLPRKSVVRLTECPDMTLDVYRGRKTTMTHTHTQNWSSRVCTLKVIHIFCNVDCTTCFTLCRWLLCCILPLLTVWHTFLVSMFPPPPPLPTPIRIFFLFRYGFFVKIHLLESSKLEGLHLRSYSHILKC